MGCYHRIILYFDGASRNNPRGPAGCGWILYEMDSHGAEGQFIAQGKNYLGYGVSNNQAEYQGLIDGLEYIYVHIQCDGLYIRGDSEIVIKQVEGEYQVHSPNIQPYHHTACSLLNDLEADNTFDFYYIRHIPRDQNWEADELANEAIDD